MTDSGGQAPKSPPGFPTGPSAKEYFDLVRLKWKLLEVEELFKSCQQQEEVLQRGANMVDELRGMFRCKPLNEFCPSFLSRIYRRPVSVRSFTLGGVGRSLGGLIPQAKTSSDNTDSLANVTSSRPRSGI